MLKRNLWTKAGLVNGALGYIRAIMYGPGNLPLDDQPIAVLVEFDKHEGPYKSTGLMDL